MSSNWFTRLLGRLRGSGSAPAAEVPVAPSDFSEQESDLSELERISPESEGEEGISLFQPEVEPPLPKEILPAVSSVAPALDDQDSPAFLKVCWKTDSGQVRGNNEDALFVFVGEQGGNPIVAPFAIGIMADGMGGHQGGEFASALASRIVAQQLLSQVYLPLLRGEERAADQPSLADLMKQAISQANYAVLQTLPGSGTTLTCAMLIGDRALIGHVGDSRAYLIGKEGNFHQLTHDHTLVQRLVEMGQLTPEEAAIHPQRNVLYRAVGQGGAMDVDVMTHLCQPGERLLLCSDGLWEMLPQEEMQRIVMESGTLQGACNRLIDAANAAGGYDNVTAILVEVQRNVI